MANNISGGTVTWDLDVNDNSLTSGLTSAKNKVSDAAHEIDNSLSNAFKNAERGSRYFLAGIGAAFASFAGFSGFGLRLSGDLESMEVGFKTLLGSSEEAAKAIEMIKRDAATTPFELPGLIRANQLLTGVTKNAVRSEELLLNVGKALAAMGKGQPELTRIIVNLQQVGAAGRAMTQDVKEFATNGIPIYDLLGKKFEDVGDAIESGLVTFEVLEELFHEAGTAGGQFATAFADQAGTFNQLVSNMKDNFTIFASEFVNRIGLMDATKRVIGQINIAFGDTDVLMQRLTDRANEWKGWLPVITGLIIGGLAPSLGIMATNMWLTFAPLIPFIALGGALGYSLKILIERFGGLNPLIDATRGFFDKLRPYVELLHAELSNLWRNISYNLIPALKDVYNVVSPIVLPLLKGLAVVFGGTLLTGILVVINGINEFVTAISWAGKIFSVTFDAMKSAFNAFVDFVFKIVFVDFPRVADAIVSPFSNALDRVKGIADQFKDTINLLNPFERHSPSLVDNVKSGIKVIEDAYRNIDIPNNIGVAGVSAGGIGDTINTNKSITINNNNSIQNGSDIDALSKMVSFQAQLL